MRAHEFITEISEDQNFYIFDRIANDVLADIVWNSYHAMKNLSDNFNTELM